jgi:transposase
MSSKISKATKGRILAYYDMKMSQVKIAELTKVPRSTVGKIIRNFNIRKILERKSGSGRPPSLKSDAIKNILDKVAVNPRISAAKIALELKEEQKIVVSDQTVRNCLNSRGYHGRSACRKPLLSLKNKKIRYETCTEWAYRPKKYWRQVIYSDECKFNLFQSDGKINVWRKSNERLLEKNIAPTVKFGGGKLVVWGVSHITVWDHWLS